MNTFSPLLIFSYGKEELPNLAELAKTLGYPDAHMASGPVSEAAKAIDGRSKAPEFIIIDIGSRSRDVLAELDELALHCEPNTCVVVIGSVNDIQFYRELKQRGIAEYLPRPAQTGDVRSAMLQATAAHEQRRQSATS